MSLNMTSSFSGGRMLCSTFHEKRSNLSRSAKISVTCKTRGGKEAIYIGKGKFINDDASKYPSRESSGLAGGWAGGETSLAKLKEEVIGSQKVIANKELKKNEGKKVVYNVKSGKEVEVPLQKDFNGLVGGWPGGEKGVKNFVATGEVLEEPVEATLGWGPAVVLGFLVVGGLVTVLLRPDPEPLSKEVTLFVAPAPANANANDVSSSVSTPDMKTAPFIKVPAPSEVASKVTSSATPYALKVAPYVLGGGVAVVGVTTVFNAAAKTFKNTFSGFGAKASKTLRIGLLAGATGLVAASIFGLLPI